MVCLTDFDVDEFDVTKAPDVDINRPLSERTPGGLGIHLVRRVTESLSYRYENRTSTIEMVIRLEPDTRGTE
jgi:anti-sigma regulatory factor (Ser/Thr protein kinase)